MPPQFAPELAAVLACGQGTALGHHDGATLWQLLPRPTSPRPISVIVAGRNPRATPGIQIHRVRHIDPAEIRIRHGIPVTSPGRTLLDLAATSPELLEQALAEGYARRLVRRSELLALIAKHPRHRGITQLRALIETGPALIRSEAERRFLALVRKARLPEPEVNVRLGPYVVDFLWRAERLVVEVDGFAFHSSRDAFERDRSRDTHLTARGFRVIRITWRRLVHEPEALLVRLAQALARS